MKRSLFWMLSLSLFYGFTPMKLENGTSIMRKKNRLYFAGNPNNRSGLSANYLFQSITRSLQKWMKATDMSLSFDYWQGTDPSIYEPNSNFNGISSIYFASQANGPTGLDPYALAVTQVWTDTQSGEILEADIAFNDQSFYFSTNPRDSTGSGAPQGPTGRAYFDNVLTHELGHTLGLTHSDQIFSTMFFVETPEQANLSCDDQAAAQSIYQDQRSKISGRVLGPGNQPVFGAHLSAISIDRGEILSTTFTLRDGSYEISGLEEGEYTLYVDPINTPAQYSTYQQGMNTRVCSGSNFSRASMKNIIQLATRQNVRLGDYRVLCNGTNAAQKIQNGTTIEDAISLGTLSSAMVIESKRSQSFEKQYFRFQNYTGELKIQNVSHILGNNTQSSFRVLRTNGEPLFATQEIDTFQGGSGLTLFDSKSVYQNLPLGDLLLEVSTQSISGALYPMLSQTLDSSGSYLLLLKNDLRYSRDAVYSTSSRCTQNLESYSYQSPGGNPPRQNFNNSSSSSKDQSFCASLPPHLRGPKPPEYILSWLCTFLFLLFWPKIRVFLTYAKTNYAT